MDDEKIVETVVRRAAAVLVASQSFLLVFFALAAWDIAAGLGADAEPPPADSERFAAAAPYIFLLPWFVIGAAALWSSHQPVSLWRLVERAVLCIVAAANFFYVYFVYFVSAGSGLNVADVVLNAVTAAGALAVAAVCALVATGRLRGQPLAD
jgi:hypothetical protein